MNYYEVWVASQRFHGDGALTYSSEAKLETGQVVTVPLQKQVVLGVVTKLVGKPTFAAKSVVKVLDIAPLPNELLGLMSWLQSYYPAPFGQLMTLLLPTSLAQQSRTKLADAKLKEASALPNLTDEQAQVVRDILSSSERMHLIHGETGTGKTRVYMELIKETLAKDNSAVLLTPEIGLTSQLATSIEAAFPGKTIILHSALTPAERRNRWQQIANAEEPYVIIGPRSALFAPVHNLGLVILDEAHDTAYKQEQAPYYQATRVAAKLGELHKAKVVLGTATPLVADYYTFEQKNLPIHRMETLAVPNNHTSTLEVIDIKNRDNFSKSSWLSTPLIAAIEAALSSGTQSLLFLNRRGSARITLCQNCGWQSLCPNCDVALTYHADTHLMQCHSCGHRASAPSSCPVCSATEIAFKSIGTKAVAEELKHLFPGATIARLDGDNLKADRLENQYEAIKSGEVDIIVGTQVIAKGLDLPKLELVGVVLADSSLNFPDYTAEERSFQLLSQVTGRANRGHRDSKVIVQTFNPDNTTITLATTKKYAEFYKSQVQERKLFNFPPFTYLLRIRVERANSKSAEKATQELATKLRGNFKSVKISDPAPAFVEKLQNRYRWQITVKARNRSDLVAIVNSLPNNIYHDLDPSNLL